MENARLTNARRNIYVPLMCQIITIICGLILPRVMLKAYGSEAYGAVSSISQFLSYIAIIEGGIGGVARAALYKPLANRSIAIIGGVVQEIERFFRSIAIIFLGYTFIIACFFNQISHIECFDWLESFSLVIIIAASTFAQYFFGISYCILLNAAQKVYLVYYINLLGTVLNTALTVFLVNTGFSLHIVKLISAVVFVSKPLILSWYTKKQFRLKEKKYPKTKLLTQKWTGLGQHLAYFFQTNTDIVVLTFFSDLRVVAVYTVYNMVVSQIQGLISSFTSGMESVFGDMIAKNENLDEAFSHYNTLTSAVSTVLFGCTAVLIVPFVKIYTNGISDENYIRVVFGLLLVVSAYIYCLRIPYHNLIIAAGHFKQTKFAAYGEATINIVLSVVLVQSLGMIGVAIGTVASTFFRMLYYAVYLKKNIINLSLSGVVKRQFVNGISFVMIVITFSFLFDLSNVTDYVNWAINAIGVMFASILIVGLFNFLFYKKDVAFLMRKIIKN